MRQRANATAGAPKQPPAPIQIGTRVRPRRLRAWALTAYYGAIGVVLLLMPHWFPRVIGVGLIALAWTLFVSDREFFLSFEAEGLRAGLRGYSVLVRWADLRKADVTYRHRLGLAADLTLAHPDHLVRTIVPDKLSREAAAKRLATMLAKHRSHFGCDLRLGLEPFEIEPERLLAEIRSHAHAR